MGWKKVGLLFVSNSTSQRQTLEHWFWSVLKHVNVWTLQSLLHISDILLSCLHLTCVTSLWPWSMKSKLFEKTFIITHTKKSLVNVVKPGPRFYEFHWKFHNEICQTWLFSTILTIFVNLATLIDEKTEVFKPPLYYLTMNFVNLAFYPSTQKFSKRAPKPNKILCFRT